MNEQEYLRALGIPDEGTPERRAHDLVTAWVWEDKESGLAAGRIIHLNYPKLIARIADALAAQAAQAR